MSARDRKPGPTPKRIKVPKRAISKGFDPAPQPPADFPKREPAPRRGT